MTEHYTELADEIMRFLDKHAKSSAAYDPAHDEPEERYNSPDGSELHLAAIRLRTGQGFDRHPWSDWGSGGYEPYNDPEARAWHDELVRKISLTVDRSARP
ncbi:hypothetical protein G6L37_05995 [Agrobacterium rubi]|nr:hypothetical protein [Agrobacterium rubi]NTF24912.1 hypothetical protein [Agrobacterium rubi]